jgi:hypothetical protein
LYCWVCNVKGDVLREVAETPVNDKRERLNGLGGVSG